MDKFSAPAICRQLDSFADNTEDMLRNEPLQAFCRLASSRRLAAAGRTSGLEHQDPRGDGLARRKALRVPSAPLTAACMVTCR